MHMKTIESAIAVIRNSCRILLTWDDEWDCWLLPNATIHEPHTADERLYWAVGDLGLPPRLWHTTSSLIVDSHKPCPQHDDTIRHYVYTLGFYDIDDWQNECEFHDLDHFEFDIGIEPDRRTYTWWTLDQMRADERMRAVNGDLLGTLELIDARTAA